MSVCLACLLPLALAGEWQRFESVEPHMGTLVRIQLYARDAASAKNGFASAFARIRELDHIFSDYNPTSELSRLAHGPPQRVSREMFELLSVARRLSVDSNGAFDVTVGALTAVWRVARSQRRMLTPQQRDAARSSIGYQHLKLDARHRTVALLRPGMRLDAGGIAKGFAAGEALAALRKLGLSRALVAISGDLAIGRPPPGKKGWTVTLEPSPEHPWTGELRNCGVSTSGDREQYLEISGVRYSHIVDPRSGLPLQHGNRVSVIAARPIIADAVATALSVSMDRGLAARYHARIIE